MTRSICKHIYPILMWVKINIFRLNKRRKKKPWNILIKYDVILANYLKSDSINTNMLALVKQSFSFMYCKIMREWSVGKIQIHFFNL